MPAFSSGGSPSCPVIARLGRQVRLRIRSLVGTSLAWVSPCHGKRSKVPSPRVAAAASAWAIRSAGNLGVEGIGDHPVVPRVFESVEQLAQDEEGRGNHSAGIPGVHAFVEHVGAQHPADHAPERGRGPELVVVAGPGVEADHEVRTADHAREVLHVGREIRRAALFRKLHEQHHPGALFPFEAERLHGGERAVERVPVVGPAASVELVPLADRLPGAEAVAPAGHFRLLVEVAVHQDGPVGLARTIEQEQRCPARDPPHVELRPRRRVPLHEFPPHPERLLHVAVGLPVGVEQHRNVRNGDVFGEGGEDLLLPETVNEFAGKAHARKSRRGGSAAATRGQHHVKSALAAVPLAGSFPPLDQLRLPVGEPFGDALPKDRASPRRPVTHPVDHPHRPASLVTASAQERFERRPGLIPGHQAHRKFTRFQGSRAQLPQDGLCRGNRFGHGVALRDLVGEGAECPIELLALPSGYGGSVWHPVRIFPRAFAGSIPGRCVSSPGI